jgi:hypothetical protein
VPTSLTGCQLWLDGNDPAGTGTPPANGAGIATWVNKGLASTNLVLYTTNGGSNPTYSANFQNGKGSVAFNNNAFLSSFPFNLSTRTIFLVCKQNVAEFCGIMGLSAANNDSVSSTTGIAFQASEGAWHFSWLYNIFNPSNQIIFAASSPSTGYYLYTGTSAIATPLNIYEEVFSSNYEQTFVNGTAGQTFTTTTTPGNSTQIYVGCRWNATGSGQSLNGNILEVIIYNTALNTTQRQEVEKYLAWKWGLASRLSTTHPAYKGPPVAFGKVPYYTAFSPLSIPTCALWLDAADSTTVTGTTTVTAWSDKSGNGRPVTITSAPSYGTTTQNKLKTLAFNNNQVTTSIASAVGTGDFTLIAVWYQSTGGTNTVLSLGTSGSSSQSLGYSATKYNFYQFGSAQESAYTTSAGSWVIQIGTRISSVKTVYINGVAGTTPSTDSYNQTVTTVTIGRGDSFGITGQIGEILVYTGTMGQTDQQKIESYLAQKWNLTAQLPVTHLNTTQPAGLPAGVPRVLLLFTALSSFMSTYYNLSGAYALVNIADSVTSLSATPAYVWTVSVPSAAKGKNGILAVFFNLFSSGQFAANQYFDYGVYVDGVAQMLGDSTGTLRYVQTALGTYAMSSSGISLGTNGLVNGMPLFVPLSFAASASQIQIGLKNSSAQMTPISSQVIAYSSNITTSTGTSNTNNFVPINTFNTPGQINYTVPTTCSIGTVTGVFIYCWGAGGGDAGDADIAGSGAFAGGYYAVAGGSVLSCVVGRGGLTGQSFSISFGGGGVGGADGRTNSGGGFTGVFLSNAGGLVQSNAVVIAGAGGAGRQGGKGGGGGYPNGFAVIGDYYGSNAPGGTQTAGGFGGGETGVAGGALQGASGGGFYGNGAGGGWYGGGAWVDNAAFRAGGGGSSYIGNINGATGGVGLTSGAVTSNGRTWQSPMAVPNIPGGNTAPFYYGTAGQNRQNGLLVIVPAVGTSATQIGVSAALYSG